MLSPLLKYCIWIDRQETISKGDAAHWVDQTWLSVLKRAEKNTIGEANIITYQKDPSFLKSSQQLSFTVTLVTQVQGLEASVLAF